MRSISAGADLHGVRQDEHGSARKPRARRPCAPGSRTPRSRPRRPGPPRLTDDRVVDTPRRARPSSTEADDRRVDAGARTRGPSALVLGRADARLRIEEDDVGDAEALVRASCAISSRTPAKRPPCLIDADAEARAAERGTARLGHAGRRRTHRDGRENVDRRHETSCRKRRAAGQARPGGGSPGMGKLTSKHVRPGSAWTRRAVPPRTCESRRTR